MSNNPTKYEVLIKPYWRSILDISPRCCIMLTFQFLVPVLTPDAVPGDEGPSLLELDLFSLMVSNVFYQLEQFTFTGIEAVLPP